MSIRPRVTSCFVRSSAASCASAIALLGALSAGAACSSERPSFADGVDAGNAVEAVEAGSGTFGVPDAAAPDAAPPDECQKMDVVFVVDDSGSMGPKQQKLRANFPRFVDVLDNYRTKAGSLLDYRLAVTSTDLVRKDYATGGSGGFVTSPATSCSGGPARAWLERTDPTVASAFACRAGLGTSGTPNEKPLGALLLAVTDREADQNRSFVRDDALLAFVILTDEDDSSGNAPSPEGLVAELDQRKSLRGRWAGAVISGPEADACGGGSFGGGAEKAPRLHDFVAKAADPATGKNNVIWRTICNDTLDDAVKDALDTFTVACRELPRLPR